MSPTKEDEMTLNATIRGAISGAILAISAAMLASPQATQAQPVKAKAGLVLVDPRDGNAARNINNVLTLYQMMINKNKALEGTAKLLTPGYVQHNPLIADGSAALGKYFAGVKAAHPSAHVVTRSSLSALLVRSSDIKNASAVFLKILFAHRRAC
jgi:hypothetical protein